MSEYLLVEINESFDEAGCGKNDQG